MSDEDKYIDLAVKLEHLAEVALRTAKVLRGEAVDWTGRGLKAILKGKIDVVMKALSEPPYDR